ncbi:MAG TPA: serine/threonine-protein kinase [Sporichthya sp.]|nr:serine/threonine-protein kinase [Sporichthya sp.]
MTDAGTTPADAGPVLVGATLGERYTLTRLIGTGGMASVWAAQDPRLDREVAIKIISDTLALDPTFVDRFQREAKIAAALSHPHVVGVFDYGTHGGRPYLVMEYVPGGTLSSRIKERRFDWDPTTLARELLDALGYIHAAGILHRDLKPANVLIGTDGRARLTDFGIAHLADATKLTSTGFIVGTEKYISPEVRRGAIPTITSDLYGLGVLLRECATAKAPAEVTELTDRLTDPDPARRPPSAGAALALLNGAASQLPPTAPMATTPDPDTPTMAMAAPTSIAEPIDAPVDAQGPAAPQRRFPRWAPGALAAAAVASLLLVLALANSGGGANEPLKTPPAGGTLTQQLDQLDSSIDRARS